MFYEARGLTSRRWRIGGKQQQAQEETEIV
jgi:hypothetical protein